MSEFHLALDRLRAQVCHCGLKGECLGCKGIEMVRQQAQAVVAAASQPILIQVAQEAAMKDMAVRFEGMAEPVRGYGSRPPIDKGKPLKR